MSDNSSPCLLKQSLVVPPPSDILLCKFLGNKIVPTKPNYTEG